MVVMYKRDMQEMLTNILCFGLRSGQVWWPLCPPTWAGAGDTPTKRTRAERGCVWTYMCWSTGHAHYKAQGRRGGMSSTYMGWRRDTPTKSTRAERGCFGDLHGLGQGHAHAQGWQGACRRPTWAGAGTRPLGPGRRGGVSTTYMGWSRDTPTRPRAERGCVGVYNLSPMRTWPSPSGIGRGICRIVAGT
jgi:hypothetical protein